MKKLICSIMFLLLCAVNVHAAKVEDAAMTVDEARLVLQKLMNSPDASIPANIMRHAKAVVIIPSMLKGGFIVGASYGTGVALIRQSDGRMSPPLFFTAGGASLGLQIGGQSTDLVLIVASERGLQGLLKNEMTIGTNMSVAAGPLGRQGTASISGASTNADLYSYSSSAGLFAGVSLGGTGLGYDRETTDAYYGKAVSINEAIKPGALKVPANGQQLIDVVNKHMGY